MKLDRGLHAFYGGTFDPPHLGHRQALQDITRIAPVTILVSEVAPLKFPSHASFQHRFEMSRLAFADIANVEVARASVNESSYTIDALEPARAKYPSLALVLGTDQLHDFPKWRRFRDIVEISHLLVLARNPGGVTETQKALRKLISEGHFPRANPISELETALTAKTSLHIVPTSAPPLSSTEVRKHIAIHGVIPENSLAPAVAQYLLTHHLYGT